MGNPKVYFHRRVACVGDGHQVDESVGIRLVDHEPRPPDLSGNRSDRAISARDAQFAGVGLDASGLHLGRDFALEPSAEVDRPDLGLRALGRTVAELALVVEFLTHEHPQVIEVDEEVIGTRTHQVAVGDHGRVVVDAEGVGVVFHRDL